MKNLNIDVTSLPDIETEVLEKGLDISHLDTINSYIIKNNSNKKPEIYVVLKLEAESRRPRLSRVIPLSKFLQDWIVVEKEDIVGPHKGK